MAEIEEVRVWANKQLASVRALERQLQHGRLQTDLEQRTSHRLETVQRGFAKLGDGSTVLLWWALETLLSPLSLLMQLRRGPDQLLRPARLRCLGDEPRVRFAWLARRGLKARWRPRAWSGAPMRVEGWKLAGVGVFFSLFVLLSGGVIFLEEPQVALLPLLAAFLAAWGGIRATIRGYGQLGLVLRSTQGCRVTVPVTLAPALFGGARVRRVLAFSEHGPVVPLDPARLLSEEALAALRGQGAPPRDFEAQVELVGAHVVTLGLQRLEAWPGMGEEARDRVLLWLHELAESIDRARALLRDGQIETACRALDYLLLQVAPRIEGALQSGRVPELPTPAGWEAIGQVPEELLQLVQRDEEAPTS